LASAATASENEDQQCTSFDFELRNRSKEPTCRSDHFSLIKTQNIWTISNNAHIADTGQFLSSDPLEIVTRDIEREAAQTTWGVYSTAVLLEGLGEEFGINRSAKSPFEILVHRLK
jgi:hypothetical protein